MEEIETHGLDRAESSLERFELAWRAYEAGETHEALQMFREVMSDDSLARAGSVDPWAREALARAAEILGRHAELRGDADAAAESYRRALRVNDSGVIARRLLLMSWRQGRIRAAAELAPCVVRSDRNLVEHLRGSETADYLTRRLEREARRKSAREGEQNA
jgi:tetratricopeptide (TPR) repeat protein